MLVKLSGALKLKRCLGLPLNILIEPTADCNYKCLKCPRQYGYKDDGLIEGTRNISFERYKSVIDEVGDTMISLRLWHYGEPFLNKDIFRMIKYANQKNIITAVSSNLSLLDKNMAEKLIDSGLDYLLVTFDGATAETYNRYSRKDAFHTVIGNIDALLKTRRQKGKKAPLVELQFIIMKENENEIGEMKKIADRLNPDKLSYVMLAPKNGPDVLYDEMPKESKYRMPLAEINRIKSCCLPWEEAVVRYSGLVLPCSNDVLQAYRMGELFHDKDDSFKNIWNNALYRRFRERAAGDINGIDICLNCGKRDNNDHGHVRIL